MLTSVGAESSRKQVPIFPAGITYNAGPHGYLDLVARARDAVDIPIIASLNGTTEAGWVDYARLIEQAGAAALELNIYRIASRSLCHGCAGGGRLCGACQSRSRSGGYSPGGQITPLFFWLSAHWQSSSIMPAPTGWSCSIALYQPDIDLVQLRWSNEIALSDADEIRLGLLWISLLSERLPRASLAGSTGVRTADEVIKYLLAEPTP
ncbi:MAG: hypothetical protein WDN50_12970 [Bradyrhizobium sp.]